MPKTGITLDERVEKLADRIGRIELIIYVGIGITVACSHFGSQFLEMATAVAGSR